MKGKLTLTCRKCTRVAVIPGPTLEIAAEVAKARGWAMDGENFICPRCPAIR